MCDIFFHTGGFAMAQEEVIRLRDLFDCDFLGLRVEAEVVREKMEEIIMKNGKVAVLDFEGVRGITHSFGDELVGIFARAFGKEWIKRNVRVINANENVRFILNLSVKLALKQSQKMSSNVSSSSVNTLCLSQFANP
jgi:hypothetical protein